MLQVGCKHGPGGKHDPGLTDEETRSHFGSWAIVSSPLTLSHDVNDMDVMKKVWPVISNKHVLAIHKAYVGDSGGLYDKSEEVVELTDAFIEAMENETRVTVPSHQYLYKPVNTEGDVAVLLMASTYIHISISQLPSPSLLLSRSPSRPHSHSHPHSCSHARPRPHSHSPLPLTLPTHLRTLTARASN